MTACTCTRRRVYICVYICVYIYAAACASCACLEPAGVWEVADRSRCALTIASCVCSLKRALKTSGLYGFTIGFTECGHKLHEWARVWG